jgi:hypothetical protein
MPSYICKFSTSDKSYYLEWSTIVDAPVTYGMSLEEFKTFYYAEYGLHAMDELEERLRRVELTGTSSRMDSSLDSLIEFNRAGNGEKQLTKEQIIKRYCTERPNGAFRA